MGSRLTLCLAHRRHERKFFQFMGLRKHLGGGLHNLLSPQMIFFYEFKLHAKFQNPKITPF